MRHTLLHAVPLFALLCTATLHAQDVRRYKVASAIIQYTMSGMQTGTETLWFDRHGMREAKLTQTTMSVAGMTVKTNSLTIFDNGTTTTVNLDLKTATRMPTPMYQDLVDATKSQGGDMTDLGMAMVKRTGAEKTGEGTVAGKPCEIWEIKSLGSKMWLWNGIVLRQETNLAGQSMKSEATAVQENVPIPEDKFAIPAGITATQGEDPRELLRKMKEKMKAK